MIICESLTMTFGDWVVSILTVTLLPFKVTQEEKIMVENSNANSSFILL